MGALVLLVCDECGHYFRDGKRSAERLRPNDFAQASGAMGMFETSYPRHEPQDGEPRPLALALRDGLAPTA